MGGRGYVSATARRAAGYSFEQFRDEFIPDGRYELVPSNVRGELKEQGLNSTTPFQSYIDRKNDYAKPDVMDEDSFNKYVGDNNLEVIYRGVADIDGMKASEMNDITLYADKYYVGRGIYGDGLYFGSSIGIAEEYARSGSTHKGSVLSGALKPTAKTIEVGDIARMMMDETKIDGYANSGALSAYARSKGYDAIKIPFVIGGKVTRVYTNVINRGAMVFSSKYGDTSGQWLF